MTIGVERSGLVAMRARRTEAQGICSRSPVALSPRPMRRTLWRQSRRYHQIDVAPSRFSGHARECRNPFGRPLLRQISKRRCSLRTNRPESVTALRQLTEVIAKWTDFNPCFFASSRSGVTPCTLITVFTPGSCNSRNAASPSGWPPEITLSWI